MQTEFGAILRVEQVAEFLQLDVRQVQRLVADGTLPRPRKIGARSVRWIRSELEAAIAAAPSDDPAAVVVFTKAFGPFAAGERAAFSPAETAVLLAISAVELVDILADWPRVRPHSLRLAREQFYAEEKQRWAERGIALEERAKRLAAAEQGDIGGDEPEGDVGAPTGPAGIPPDVQGQRESAIRRARKREPIAIK